MLGHVANYTRTLFQPTFSSFSFHVIEATAAADRRRAQLGGGVQAVVGRTGSEWSVSCQRTEAPLRTLFQGQVLAITRLLPICRQVYLYRRPSRFENSAALNAVNVRVGLGMAANPASLSLFKKFLRGRDVRHAGTHELSVRLAGFNGVEPRDRPPPPISVLERDHRARPRTSSKNVTASAAQLCIPCAPPKQCSCWLSGIVGG
jgi:hypothetical protein